MDWTNSLFKNLLGEVQAPVRAAAAVLEGEEVQALAAEVVRAVRAAVKREDHAVSTGAVPADPIAQAIAIQAPVRAAVLVSCLYFDHVEVVQEVVRAIIQDEVQAAVPANVQEVVSAIVQAPVRAVAVAAAAVQVAVPAVQVVQAQAVLVVVPAVVPAAVPVDLGQLTFVVNPSLATLFLFIGDPLEKTAIWLNYIYGDKSKRNKGQFKLSLQF